MHADQVDVRADVVARLVAAQLPQWAGLAVRPLASDGTVNALFRLGDSVVLRFPLQPRPDESMQASLVREQDSARLLAGRVPLAVPEPLALGGPGEGYDGWWTAYRWIPGTTAGAEELADPVGVARDLAGFVLALHALETEGPTWPPGNRFGPFADKTEGVRRWLAMSRHLVDVAAVERAWAGCLLAQEWQGPDVWVHADLMPGNLLLDEGRVTAVLDLATVGVGDPAVDLMPAWNLFAAPAREAYRQALGVDDSTWQRGRGWAIVQAVAALPYYIDSNPTMAATASRTLAAVLE